MASIEIKDLTLEYTGTRVLEKLNLSIEEGEFIVLLGPSGCGKSTLLSCIAGLLDINGGQIMINERNVTWEEPKDRGVGMVFQSYALYPQMSVRGNLSFGLKNAGLPKAEIEERIERTSKLLHIHNLLERKPAALSGGQRQRVAIGRALVRDVNVFLFDEPLSNLDAKLRAELRVEIKRLHHQLGNNTMVYVTHDQIEALTLADRIALMRAGRIEQLADPGTIYNRPSNLYVAGFIGSPAMNIVDARLREEGGRMLCSFGGVDLDTAGYSAEEASSLQDGREVVLGLRPEHLVVGEAGEGCSPLGDCQVEIIEPMGADTLLWVQVAGQSVSVRIEGTSSHTEGERLPLSVKIGFVSIFDKQSEDRL